jgi:hypothetical protein
MTFAWAAADEAVKLREGVARVIGSVEGPDRLAVD